MRPIEHLPIPFPKDFDPSEEQPDFFYQNFAKAFIPDMIHMMDVGLEVDPEAVEDLRETVEKVLDSVDKRLAESPLIQEFMTQKLPHAQKEHAKKVTAAVRDLDYYLKEYKPSDMMHRTWVVNTWLKQQGRSSECKEKWTLADVKGLQVFMKAPFLKAVIEKRMIPNNPTVKAGMIALAEYKLDLWNRPRYEKAQQKVELPPFNPGSTKQMREFFDIMGITPLAFSKDTGEPSWGRDQLEQLRGEVTDKDLIFVLDAFLDHSSSAIIKNNFLAAFDKFTIDDVLHGNIVIFGAKSFRNTSNSPNLLNAPSTGTIYAKPLKRCFVAREGGVIYTADLSALEDRVIANLSGDTNKCNVFLEGLDGHSLAALNYGYPELSALSLLFQESEDPTKGKYFVEEIDGKLIFSREYV